MPQSRQLAAIMFTDIVGYTALMGDDEQMHLISFARTSSMKKTLIEKYCGK